MAEPIMRATSGDPETAVVGQDCDDDCSPRCVIHVSPAIGWDLSFGSRINFHAVAVGDDRLMVSLHLSDDALANGAVYREVTPDQLVAFAHGLLTLALSRTEVASRG